MSLDMNNQQIITRTIALQLRKSQDVVKRILENAGETDLPDCQKVLTLAYKLGYFATDDGQKVKTTQPERGQLMTVSALAFLLRLSSATVSRALNGSARVSELTRARVLAAASELGFELNRDASELRRRGTGNTTIADIADRLNISVSTVSRCFSESGEVSLKTRHKVLSLASEMGFIPNEQASRLRRC